MPGGPIIPQQYARKDTTMSNDTPPTLARAAQAAEEVDRLRATLTQACQVEQQAARDAVEAGATRYRVAQVMGRSQPTIKRWVP